ncbi:hypothetical protein [Streptomyces niger]|uniref:hypothetical protein n=1 Tax=Streptomyces niger TaxID=66373 RepID=UPI00069B093C|nr:hypothetical protein [Streptomyces niger]
MLKHANAPTRFFTLAPNEIIRHPRLSSDAKVLLLWALSLPEGAETAPQDIARQAGWNSRKLTRAKRELAAERYLYEWRYQGSNGRWATDQLISNEPLEKEQAARVRHGAPSEPKPPVGAATDRPVGRPPEDKTRENTPHPAESADEAVVALAAVSRAEPRLRLSGRDVRELAPLAAEWLARGATSAELHTALTSGLPYPIHSPAALVRDRLTRKLPDPPPEPPEPGGSPPSAAARVRTCTDCAVTDFVPLQDERRCRNCRRARADTAPAPLSPVTVRGAALVRAGLRRRLPAPPAPA